MKKIIHPVLILAALLLLSVPAKADDYNDTKKMFTDAGLSDYFSSAYGYALFPTIGKGGFVIGGAYGEGRVYRQGTYIGDTTMAQATIGFQLGGLGFSEVIFFQDKRALDEFTSGSFEFGAEAQATVITAAVGATAKTTGSSATASGGKNNAITDGTGYTHGMATYAITKGGLMYELSLGGQKFSYKAK